MGISTTIGIRSFPDHRPWERGLSVIDRHAAEPDLQQRPGGQVGRSVWVCSDVGTSLILTQGPISPRGSFQPRGSILPLRGTRRSPLRSAPIRPMPRLTTRGTRMGGGCSDQDCGWSGNGTGCRSNWMGNMAVRLHLRIRCIRRQRWTACSPHFRAELLLLRTNSPD